jgi:hypothetical protein
VDSHEQGRQADIRLEQPDADLPNLDDQQQHGPDTRGECEQDRGDDECDREDEGQIGRPTVYVLQQFRVEPVAWCVRIAGVRT